MESYRLEGQTFGIDDYDRKPAFSSFLPGLAGIIGPKRMDYEKVVDALRNVKEQLSDTFKDEHS